MERGDTGNHHAAAKERLLFVTGAPVEPHSSLPQRLALPVGRKRWLWPQLLKSMIEPLGLTAGSDQPAVAAATLKRAGASGGDGEDDGEPEADDVVFEPDAYGYHLTLADGSASRLRFRKVHGALLPEIRRANRDIPIPQGMEMPSLARRVLNYFSIPHMVTARKMRNQL